MKRIPFLLFLSLLLILGCSTRVVKEAPKNTRAVVPEDNPYRAPIPADRMPPIVVPDGRPITVLPQPGVTVTLSSLSEGLPTTGLWRQNLALADMNGDGNIDIISGPPRGGYPEKHPFIFLGDGHGKWKEWKATYPAAYYQYGGVDVADIDGNGLLDILMTGHYAPTLALFQETPGNFTSHSEGLPVGREFSSRTVKALDVDGNGGMEIFLLADTNMDVAQKRFAGNLQRLYSYDKTTKSWSAKPEGLNNRDFGDRAVVADFNGDGHPDIAASNHIQREKHILFYRTPDGWDFSAIYALPSNAYTFDVASGDLNGDDRPDLVISQVVVLPVNSPKTTRRLYHRSVLTACINTSDGWNCREIGYLSTHLFFEAVTVADFDGNGFDDVAALQKRTGKLYLFLNDGQNFTTARVEGWTLKGRPYWAGAADADGDGRPELFVAFGGEKGAHNLTCWHLNVQ